MSIEFPCANCGQTLRVADDAAGKRAKCPQCKGVVDIPLRIDSATTPSPLQSAWDQVGDTPFRKEEPNPYSAPQQTAAPTYSTRAGSPFASDRIGNAPVDVGRVLNYAWDIWTQNLGLLVGAFVVMIAISMALFWGQEIVKLMLIQAGLREAVILVSIGGGVVRWLLDVYLSIGLCQISLRLARQQPVEFSELFNGGARLLPVIGVSILFGLAIAGGLMLLIIPGVIVWLMWWPCYYLVVDNKATVADSFGMARHITQDNVGNSFVLWIVGVGIVLVGFLALCIGVIFAAPLVTMMYTVAYLMMSEQMPPEPGATSGRPFA